MSEEVDYFKSKQCQQFVKRCKERRRQSITVPCDWPLPEYLVRKFDHAGLQCAIMRGPMSLCGYVHVPKGYRDNGKHYNDVDVEVHGGLTFVCRSHEGGTWFGFDTMHSGDMMVLPARSLPEGGFVEMGRIWTVDDVVQETVNLAQQLIQRNCDE